MRKAPMPRASGTDPAEDARPRDQVHPGRPEVRHPGRSARAYPARARGPHDGGRGSHQRGDRGAALPLGQDGRSPCFRGAGEARRPHPCRRRDAPPAAGVIRENWVTHRQTWVAAADPAPLPVPVRSLYKHNLTGTVPGHRTRRGILMHISTRSRRVAGLLTALGAVLVAFASTATAALASVNVPLPDGRASAAWAAGFASPTRGGTSDPVPPSPPAP